MPQHPDDDPGLEQSELFDESAPSDAAEPGASAASKRQKAPKPPRQRGRVRKAVFGSIWLVIGVVVAASLAKVAFFSQESTEEGTPTGQLESPTVEATRGPVTNEFVVTGSVTADAGVPQRATEQGTVTVTYVQVGDRVEYGQALFEVREEVGQTDPQPVGEPDPETGEQQLTDPEPVYQYHVIYSQASGTVTEFTPLPKMQVAIGETIGEVGPGTFTVVADLAADLQYRMLEKPATATVTITGGPAPFECSSLEIGAPDDDAEQPQTPVDPYTDPYAMSGSEGGTVTGQVRCAVPDGEAVFAGLGAEVAVVADSVDDALLVPTTAVRGDYATGIVYVVDAPGGEPQEVMVELGITDGMVIEVTSGLDQGQLLLEYVPSEVPMYEDDIYGGY
ncbi:efflux RND transporter periplasmic adaptor subunit [Gulosibacter faecalis]|uniref:Efflux RND transporter periplasmic adaptor subunit n=1 Tax=Gulosibacter faecalis TaxID=272240 RepID=A0ABW5UTY8_9MICO|nr:efflux RND transporter periplasmic adaptor subunit [Gulosibacter faecalis]